MQQPHFFVAFLRRARQIFFRLLYHHFAWTYDGVAAIVSLGRWRTWTHIALQYASGPRVLEVGYGPGHLLQELGRTEGISTVGLDESNEMSRIARRQLRSFRASRVELTRGVARHLPFAAASFDSVLSTFPADFIFERATHEAIHRVLKPRGRLIVVPLAWIVGKSALERISAWLFAATGQVPQAAEESVRARLVQPLLDLGFEVALKRTEIRSSTVLIVVASKPALSPPGSQIP